MFLFCFLFPHFVFNVAVLRTGQRGGCNVRGVGSVKSIETELKEVRKHPRTTFLVRNCLMDRERVVREAKRA